MRIYQINFIVALYAIAFLAAMAGLMGRVTIPEFAYFSGLTLIAASILHAKEREIAEKDKK